MVVEERVSSWDAELTRHATAHSLVGIAREGRLVRVSSDGAVRVALNSVDESVLALVDLAMTKHRDISFVYPAPAGEVAVLLCAEIVLQKFVEGDTAFTVGLLTADTSGASRTWERIRIAAQGSRARIAEFFPSFRATPEGFSPYGKKPHKGLLIGSTVANWPVQLIVVDHLGGPVRGNISAPSVHVFADPFDAALEEFSKSGGLVWGWPLGRLSADHKHSAGPLRPFSVAQERLAAIEAGIHTTVHVAHEPTAEKCIARIRDDLKTIAELHSPIPPRAIIRGVRVAWQHLTTLATLPCRPSDFESICGTPSDSRARNGNIRARNRSMGGRPHR